MNMTNAIASPAIDYGGAQYMQQSANGTMSRNVDVQGLALAVMTVKVATDAMQAQFDQYQHVFTASA